MIPALILAGQRPAFRLSGYFDPVGEDVARGVYRVRWTGSNRHLVRPSIGPPYHGFSVGPNRRVVLCEEDGVAAYRNGLHVGSAKAHFPSPAGWLGDRPVVAIDDRLRLLILRPHGIALGPELPRAWKGVASNPAGSVAAIETKGHPAVLLLRRGRPDRAWRIAADVPKALGGRFFLVDGSSEPDYVVDGEGGTVRRLPWNLGDLCPGDAPERAWGTTETWNRSGRRPLRTIFWTVDLLTFRRRRAFSVSGSYRLICLSKDGGWLIAMGWIAEVGPERLVAIDLRTHATRTLCERAYSFQPDPQALSITRPQDEQRCPARRKRATRVLRRMVRAGTASTNIES